MIVTLLTDFGTQDYFVGAMKGALLSVNPHAHIIDITHEIPPHDIQAGAFTLLAAYKTFPAHTIHVAVVDPGVGSRRRPLLIEAHEHFFIGPDNGLFSYICEREPASRVFHLTNERYFRSEVSRTFHGRDIFAPVAGALSNGVAPDELGELVCDDVRLAPLAAGCNDDGTLNASIIHIDRFGNCVTNISRRELTDEMIARGAWLEAGGHVIKSFRRFFSEEGTKSAELFAVWGSAGFLEIAVNCESAAERINLRRGDGVRVSMSNQARIN